ncbi:uncharacterized protein KNAG_0C06680 [Huiozyma naganishii CBS 8797]|uniref:Hyphally-regulated cell wall protein N-terminal domain-containing protein n=1 Tax=Huiozyma naganishii (strain ATCC MYA-139 / BCRC 22969 / CBS 8797 / KCTC 17520 / NBRC 10181 / NCYC 3082 / Yp74L-3) TaxID=1071383 RepID=J7S6H2_HUIN7|nr:hypothetical protein KNAG_0C06680 [Kazachstania naganishii CBS 8797]CCK69761.1 hypothetical protein KNAG_0C06680 [Kazachstania naganishii CBS 8797]
MDVGSKDPYTQLTLYIKPSASIPLPFVNNGIVIATGISKLIDGTAISASNGKAISLDGDIQGTGIIKVTNTVLEFRQVMNFAETLEMEDSALKFSSQTLLSVKVHGLSSSIVIPPSQVPLESWNVTMQDHEIILGLPGYVEKLYGITDLDNRIVPCEVRLSEGTLISGGASTAVAVITFDMQDTPEPVTTTKVPSGGATVREVTSYSIGMTNGACNIGSTVYATTFSRMPSSSVSRHSSSASSLKQSSSGISLTSSAIVSSADHHISSASHPASGSSHSSSSTGRSDSSVYGSSSFAPSSVTESSTTVKPSSSVSLSPTSSYHASLTGVPSLDPDQRSKSTHVSFSVSSKSGKKTVSSTSHRVVPSSSDAVSSQSRSRSTNSGYSNRTISETFTARRSTTAEETSLIEPTGKSRSGTEVSKTTTEVGEPTESSKRPAGSFGTETETTTLYTKVTSTVVVCDYTTSKSNEELVATRTTFPVGSTPVNIKGEFHTTTIIVASCTGGCEVGATAPGRLTKTASKGTGAGVNTAEQTTNGNGKQTTKFSIATSTVATGTSRGVQPTPSAGEFFPGGATPTRSTTTAGVSIYGGGASSLNSSLSFSVMFAVFLLGVL